MKIYLAGSGWEKLWMQRSFYSFNRLESFAYISKKEETIIEKYTDFLLDSGAFTYLNGLKSEKVNWDNYIEKYSSFINLNNINLFFELDIDSIVGTKVEVLIIGREWLMNMIMLRLEE